MASFYRAYDAALKSSPILTKSITSAVLFGMGDLMAQKLEKRDSIDWSRSGRMTAWGAMFTPLAHYWYMYLDKFIPGSGAFVVAKKVAADQLTWTVAINSAFFFSTSMMEHGDPGKAVQSISDKLWPTLEVNWLVWPGLAAINLSVVPLDYRILFINFCSLFWSAYLSNMANSGKPAAPAVADAPAAAAKTTPPPPSQQLK